MASDEQAIDRNLPDSRQGNFPVVRIAGAWRALPGSMFGFRQPAIIGEMTARSDGKIDLTALDRAIGDLTRDFEFTLPDATFDKGLISRTLGLAIAVQNCFNIPVQGGFHVGSARPFADDQLRVEVALPYHDQAASRIALSWAIPTIDRLVRQIDGTVADAGAADGLSDLGGQFAEHAPPNKEIVYLLRAAMRQEIPVHRLVANIYCFGTGRHRLLMDSTVTDRTTELGCRISRNKIQTAQLLRLGGLPGPQQAAAPTVEGAVAAAEGLGYPVVIKPMNLSQGRGVFAGLKDAEAVREAFAEAIKLSDKLIVEKHFQGRDYRLTVLNGEVVKVMGRVPGGVTGDGRSTIAELVALKQDSPRFRRKRREGANISLSLDGEALSMLVEQSLTADSVVESGQFVQLRRKSNISTGGEQVFVSLEEVHPDNLALAARSASLLDLDLSGVDLIIADIARPWTENGALICEINAAPEISDTTTPTIHDEILRDLIGPVARVPAHLLVASNERISDVGYCRALADELSCNAFSTRDGVWIDGERLPGQPEDDFSSARMMLREQQVRSALCVMSLPAVGRKGLPVDWFDSIRIDLPEKVPASLLSALQPNAGSPIT